MNNVLYLNRDAHTDETLSKLRVKFLHAVRDKGIKHFVIHYHNPCSDGLAALYSAVRGLKQLFNNDYSITSVTAKYGTVPDLNYGPNTCLVVVDFAYTPEVLAQAQVGMIVLLDHHETSVKMFKSSKVELGDDNIIIFDDKNTMSGAGLSWRFFNTETIPHLIAAIERRDLWDKNYLFVEEAHLFASKYNSVDHFHMWDKATSTRENLVSILSEFTPLVEKQEQICRTIAQDAIIKHLYVIRVKDQMMCPVTGATRLCDLAPGDDYFRPHRVCSSFAIVNCHGQFASDVGSILNEKAVVSIMFSVLGPDTVKISIRCAVPNNPVVLALAGQYGGGGHAGAAGCVMTMDEFTQFYKDNFSNVNHQRVEAAKSSMNLFASIKHRLTQKWTSLK